MAKVRFSLLIAALGFYFAAMAESKSDNDNDNLDGDEYVRVFTAEQFLNALKSNAMILVAKNTKINLTPLLDDGSQFRTRYR